jgi:hypothetical protein
MSKKRFEEGGGVSRASRRRYTRESKEEAIGWCLTATRWRRSASGWDCRV